MRYQSKEIIRQAKQIRVKSHRPSETHIIVFAHFYMFSKLY